MTAQKRAARNRRVHKMIPVLKNLFPNPGIVLNYSNNWELLVAVILSAQCTDKQVNKVTAELFKKYRTLADYVAADPNAFANDIRSTGFYKNKAKNILAAAKKVQEDFGGRVPDTMDELLSLPGVARKTANVVLGNAFGVVEGIAVDTHVRRFAIRFDLTDHTNPVKIERDLMEIVPEKYWFTWTYWMIEYGRQYCPARKHECGDHPLTKIYPRAAQRWV